MFGRTLFRFALTLPISALAFAGCGGGSPQPEPQLRGAHLTIYSSSPQRGPLRAIGADVLDAERLALAQDSGRVGRYRVRMIALDASTPGVGRSDPAQISLNARRAAKDPRTVAYLGELATGTSAISIPLTNEAGILQVSPLDTAMALTTASLAVAGSPERFYPKLRVLGRTFARVVPSDRGEVDALLADMRRAGVRRLALLTDERSDRPRARRRTWAQRRTRRGSRSSHGRRSTSRRCDHDDSIARMLAGTARRRARRDRRTAWRGAAVA